MSKLRAGALIGLITLTGALSLASDCDIDIEGDDGGFVVDVDNDNDDFWDNLEDFFD